MTKIRLKYVHRFRDRIGRIRHYLRRPGFPRATLPGLPGSAEFMAAYQTALATAKRPVGEARELPGSVSALVRSYYDSPAWNALAPITQRKYRELMERFRAEHSDKPVRLLEPRHVRAMVAKIAARTPGQANKFLTAIRVLMRHAIDIGLRDDDPTRDVRRIRYAKRPFTTWSEEQIAQFEARWPVGTRARLAFDLLLYTGQRRGDVIRLGPQHFGPHGLRLVQQKTKAELVIPIHPALRASLAAGTVQGHLAFLVTEAGRPFASGNAFYNWFKDCLLKAGLPAELGPHGLRKAAARRLAEAGCTPHEIAAITGHATLAEVERYTRAADQRRLAEAAIVKIARPAGGNEA
jgi:integrase